MTIDELRVATADREVFAARAFELLRSAANLHATAMDEEEAMAAREIIIQCREHRDALGAGTRAALDALVRELGLFPYLDDDTTLTDRDLLARETLRIEGLKDGEIVLHAAQASVFARLLDGDNVILSAPTSFGKSLLIDVLLASGRYDNVLVVVPTLALIDEIRRRLALRNTGHKVVTHPTQEHGSRNVFVMTAERVLQTTGLPKIELFVLDEFYKLGGGDQRAQVLNQVFYEMRRSGAQYYLLGPNVEGLDSHIPAEVREEFVRSDDTTVALRFHDVAVTNAARGSKLVELAESLGEKVLIYCQSPRSAHKTARLLVDSGVGVHVPALESAAEWVGTHYHEDWTIALALGRGIGVHHGQIPRALGQFMVKEFENNRIKILIATGTLIEGVNTHARHVIMYDKQRPGPHKMDAFTFRNISGRCGRMFHHFSGDVWLFGKRPSGDLPEVDIPILSQNEEAPPSLLQQIAPEDLSERSQERLEPFRDQVVLSEETLRANVGLDLAGQIAIAEKLRDDPETWHAELGFDDTPTFAQLNKVCTLLWEHLSTGSRHPLSSAYTTTPLQLARQLTNFSFKASIRALIDEQVEQNPDAPIDELVTDVCGFARNIAGYTFPIRLRALERIQREVFVSIGLVPGDYMSYIARVEGLFLDAPLAALDEYGVPPELANKLRKQLLPDGNLDAVLVRLADLEVLPESLTPFERELVVYAREGL